MELKFSNKSTPDWQSAFKKWRFGVNPQTDWKIIVFLTLLFSVAAIFLSVSFYLYLDKQEVFVSGGESDLRLINLEKLKETTTYYETKARTFEAFKATGPKPFVDPSV
jgi:hypothetical protein